MISNILKGKKPFALFTNIGQKQNIVFAAFIKYLIEKYDIQHFGQLWKQINGNAPNPFKVTYNKSLTELENEFYLYLGHNT